MPKMDRGTDSRLRGSHSKLLGWFASLAQRLRRVRVCCGEWTRVLGPSPTVSIGVTAVFLDPPYDPIAIGAGVNKVDGLAPTDALYAHHDPALSKAVREWAIVHGDDSQLRIALCGYEGEHEMPGNWQVLCWKAAGGYSLKAANGPGKQNRERERIWFSPHCLPERRLFAQEETTA